MDRKDVNLGYPETRVHRCDVTVPPRSLERSPVSLNGLPYGTMMGMDSWT
jgi:hypothetical protein